MSKQEKDFIKQVDEMILNASPEFLEKIRAVDLKSQLSGKSLYDSLLSDGLFGSQKIQESLIGKKNHLS